MRYSLNYNILYLYIIITSTFTGHFGGPIMHYYLLILNLWHAEPTMRSHQCTSRPIIFLIFFYKISTHFGVSINSCHADPTMLSTHTMLTVPCYHTSYMQCHHLRLLCLYHLTSCWPYDAITLSPRPPCPDAKTESGRHTLQGQC